MPPPSKRTVTAALSRSPSASSSGKTERLPRRVRLDRLLPEEPAGGVVVVRGHVDEEAAGRRPDPRARASARRARRRRRRSGPSDRALGDAPPGLDPARRRSGGGSRPGRPAPDAAARRADARPAPPPSSRPASRGRGACPACEHRARVLGVVDRARGEDDRVDVVRGEELLVACSRARRARPQRLGAPARPRRRDRDQLDARRARARSGRGRCPCRRARRLRLLTAPLTRRRRL